MDNGQWTMDNGQWTKMNRQIYDIRIFWISTFSLNIHY